ncbi:zinc finger protein 484-like [Etheostoma cragini]|uniref:zinc finger protein 484-like n=1 Tax=Etheostoma cragini TaxID=417921 RepID=UPI00155E9C92|nr:zinc finger protein 484-like [Etheostoma cragini]
METDADGEDCGRPGPAWNSNPLLQPETDNSVDSDVWKDASESRSGLNSLDREEVHVSDDKESFSCFECGKKFGTKQHLKRHMKSHTGEKPFSCTVCGKIFIQKVQLTEHMRTHTGEKPFSCSVCQKAFARRQHLQRHVMIHTGEKPFSCSVCDQGVLSKEHLKTHMRTHTGERPFSCSVCGKAFIGSGNLKRHMRNHTGEKPFSCSVCDKSFGQKVQLTQHMRVHTGDKPCVCSVCNLRILSEAHLKVHMRTHTGEKPFSCSFCGKGFTQAGNLTHHMRVHTGEKRFSCSVCDKTFAWLSQVKTHKCVGRPCSQQTQTEEDREAEPPASRGTQHMETEADEEDCRGPEPARNSHLLLQQETEEQIGNSAEPETEDSNFLKERSVCLSGLNSLKHDEVTQSDETLNNTPVQIDRRSQMGEGHFTEARSLRRHIKEEQEELYISQEREQLQGLEEADITKFPFTPVPVKSDDDEEEAQSSQLKPRQTQHMETEGTCDVLKKSGEPPSGLISLKMPAMEPLNPRLASTVSASASCSSDGEHFYQRPWQHPDIEIRDVTPEEHLKLLWMSQGRADRYGCSLFRFITPEEKYRAWCVTTNWDGSRGKWALPRNLKAFLLHTLHQRFQPMAAREEKMLIDSVNEVLRTPRQFSMGLMPEADGSQTATIQSVDSSDRSSPSPTA